MKRKGRAEGREEAAKSALESLEMEGEKNIKLRERNPSRSAGGKVVTSPRVRAESVRPGAMEGMLIKTGEKRSGVLGPTIMSEEELATIREKRAEKAREEDENFRLEGFGEAKDPEAVYAELSGEAVQPDEATTERRDELSEGITTPGLQRLRQIEGVKSRRDKRKKEAEKEAGE